MELLHDASNALSTLSLMECTPDQCPDHAAYQDNAKKAVRLFKEMVDLLGSNGVSLEG